MPLPEPFASDWLLTSLVAAFFLAGGGLLLGGASLFFSTLLFVFRSSVASGTVIALVKPKLDGAMLRTTKTSGGRTYKVRANPKSPKVRFTTDAGTDVEFTDHMASDPPSFHMGQQVRVRYDPLRPEKAQLNTFSSLWLAPLLLCAIGALMTGLVTAFVLAKLG